VNELVQKSTMFLMLSKVDILEGDDETFLAVEKEVFSQEFNDNLF
jgi:hypothetical protein